MKRSRGRPYSYDRDTVIELGMQLFLEKSYASITIDKICERCTLSKPSFYEGFGNKEKFFLLVSHKYQSIISEKIELAASKSKTTEGRLKAIFKAAKLHYYTWNYPTQGCLVLSTAPAEAAQNQNTQQLLLTTITKIDSIFSNVFSQDQRFSKRTSNNLAMIASAIFQSISLRARAGQTEQESEKMIEQFIKQIQSM